MSKGVSRGGWGEGKLKAEQKKKPPEVSSGPVQTCCFQAGTSVPLDSRVPPLRDPRHGDADEGEFDE